MTANSPKERRRLRVTKRLKSPQFLNALAMFIVAGGIGVAMTIHIQDKYDLYRTSTTMSLIGAATAIVMMVVIALLDRRWYFRAWAFALIAPPIMFLFALRILERNPPIGPLG